MKGEKGEAVTATEIIDFACPKCKEVSKVTIHKSINATAAPEARQALLDGKVNSFACPQCGQKGYLLISLFYHDMDRKFIVQYHPFPAVRNDDFLKEFDPVGHPKLDSAKLAQEIDKKLSYFRDMHVVFDLQEMCRYIIFRERLSGLKQGRK
jgi:predicted RNA-binding Zn-ribbon protein involved in translation (DUF1610 family)